MDNNNDINALMGRLNNLRNAKKKYSQDFMNASAQSKAKQDEFNNLRKELEDKGITISKPSDIAPAYKALYEQIDSQLTAGEEQLNRVQQNLSEGE